MLRAWHPEQRRVLPQPDRFRMIYVRRKGLTFGEVWFDEEWPTRPRADILMFCQRPIAMQDGPQSRFLSLVIDISQDEDSILAGIGPQTRYQIRRCATKDGVSGEFMTRPHDRLDEFANFYDGFARQKGLGPAHRAGLTAAAAANQLVLSAAWRDGEALVWHAYIIFGSTAGLLHTGSQFRGGTTEQTRLIGRANRWLHYEDMLRFKEMGLTKYNWGGLFEDTRTPERAGINRFKEDFGGQRVCTYNALVPVTHKGRAYLGLRSAWRRIRGDPPERAGAESTA